jgi:hypothetical protein
LADVVKLKKYKRAPRNLVEIDKASGAARFFDKMVRDIEADYGGRREISRIASELIGAFAGSATALRYMNAQIQLGESIAELDLGAYATLASTMLRIGNRLGLRRTPRDITDQSLAEILRQGAEDMEEAEQIDG